MLNGDLAAARVATKDLLNLVPHYCLSQAIDACLPTSAPLYKQFYEEVLRSGAEAANLLQ